MEMIDSDTQVLINKQTDFKDTYIRFRKLLVHIYTCIDLDIHRYNNNICTLYKNPPFYYYSARGYTNTIILVLQNKKKTTQVLGLTKYCDFLFFGKLLIYRV